MIVWQHLENTNITYQALFLPPSTNSLQLVTSVEKRLSIHFRSSSLEYLQAKTTGREPFLSNFMRCTVSSVMTGSEIEWRASFGYWWGSFGACSWDLSSFCLELFGTPVAQRSQLRASAPRTWARSQLSLRSLLDALRLFHVSFDTSFLHLDLVVESRSLISRSSSREYDLQPMHWRWQ